VRDKELIKLASDGADRRAKTMLEGLQLILNPKIIPSQVALIAPTAPAESFVDAAKRKVAELKYKLRIFPIDSDRHKTAKKELVSLSSGVPLSELTDTELSKILVEDVLTYS
jgi:hypothetical protein